MAREQAVRSLRDNASKLFAEGLPTAQRLANPKDIQASIIQLRADAEAIRPLMRDITAYIIDIARADIESVRRPPRPAFQNAWKLGDTKGAERMEYKIVYENSCDPTKIFDGARDQVKGEDLEEIGAACAAVEDLYRRGVELPHGARIINVSNRFERATDRGYSSTKVNLAVPHPDMEDHYVIYETMIVHKGFEEMIENARDVGGGSHGLYERIREIEDAYAEEALPPEVSREFGILMQQVKAMHGRAREHYNLDQIDFQHWRQIRAQNARQQALLDGPEYVI